jgi:hypothetical protein
MSIAWIILLAGCAGPPTDAITWREQWELLILTEDGGLVDARVGVGNTGILRRQGHLRANRWSAVDSPILFGLDGGPGDVDVSDSHDAIRVGSALLGRYESGDNWTLRVSDDDANAIVHVNPGGPVPPMATSMDDSGQWTMTSPITHGAAHGWFTAGRRGGMFEGRAIALHRGGDGRPSGPRQAAFVLGTAISIGFDEQGDQRLAWARIGDMDVPMDDLRQTIDADGMHTLDFRPTADLEVRLRPNGVGGSLDVHDHLYAPEKVLAQAAGLLSYRTVLRADVELLHQGEQLLSTGVIIRAE